MINNREKKLEDMLKNYVEIVNEIKNIGLDIEEISREYEGVSGISLNERTGTTYKISRPIEDELIKKYNRLELLSNIKENKERMKQKIDNALQVLSEKEREVITLRYIQARDKSWDYIAMKSDLSEAWVRALKKKAIKKMAPIVFPIENNDKIAL